MADDNVIQLPREEPPELLIGPFTSYKVQVDGRIIPRLTGFREGDKIWLTVDDRFTQPFSTFKDAHSAAVLIAQAMAIAEGYSHLGAPNKDMPFAPIGHSIGKPDA